MLSLASSGAEGSRVCGGDNVEEGWSDWRIGKKAVRVKRREIQSISHLSSLVAGSSIRSDWMPCHGVSLTRRFVRSLHSLRIPRHHICRL